MTELDFDELDKAVTSIMSGIDTSKRKDGLDDPEDKVIEIPSTDGIKPVQPAGASQPPTEQPQSESAAPSESPASSPVQQNNSSEPLAIKRRGQFMDVMHPSSDMKTTVAPRREGIVLQPTARFEASHTEESTDKEERSDEAPAQSPVIDVVATPDTEPASGGTTTQAVSSDAEKEQSSWPDPIELAENTDGHKDIDGDGVTDPALDPIVAVPKEVIEEVANPATEQPISSPFLADAKVEKRPLGTATPFPESVATPDSTQSVPNTTPAIPLPEELKSDVMELESSSTVGSAEASEPQSQQTPSKPTISGSIPQQYTEQPSTSNVSNSAIYDTSTHHQPLDGGVKSASPMKWVILALVLLIVGALAGAAYFYLKTQ